MAYSSILYFTILQKQLKFDVAKKKWPWNTNTAHGHPSKTAVLTNLSRKMGVSIGRTNTLQKRKQKQVAVL